MSTEQHANEAEYRYIEYEADYETLAIIQDVRNSRAWIQSTVSEPVRQ